MTMTTHDIASMSEKGRAAYREWWKDRYPTINDFDLTELPVMDTLEMFKYLLTKKPLTPYQERELWDLVKEAMEGKL